jgi:NADPH2:quinone reductase
MRALLVESLAADYAGCALRTIPDPQPAPGEVRVRVRAAAVNFPDLLQTRGEYQHKPALPFIPGLELAGEIEMLGPDVGDFALGQAVVGRPRLGGFSELAVVPTDALRRKPDRMTFGQAAGFGAAYLTAYVALVRRARLEPGEWVLVHGAAGGVGLAAVDLAKALGARVIAASASDEKLAVIGRDYTPDALVNVMGGFRERVKELTDGFTSGRIPTLPVNMALIKGFSLIGVRAGEYGRRFPDQGRENAEAVWALAEAGRLNPRVDREFPLAQWREAFDTLAGRRVIGKTILRPDL